MTTVTKYVQMTFSSISHLKIDYRYESNTNTKRKNKTKTIIVKNNSSRGV